jgi:hypothetical protein
MISNALEEQADNCGDKKSGIEIAGIRTLPLSPVNLFENDKYANRRIAISKPSSWWLTIFLTCDASVT